MTFRGDRSADLVRNYRFAEAVDAAFWEGLGLGERSCEERTVVFTDEFADEPDTDPRSEPNAAFDAATCTEWINSETFADNPWGLAYTATHEGGHDRGVRDSADPDSLMYDNNQGDDARDRRFGEPAPEAATKERFERQFGVDLEFKGR